MTYRGATCPLSVGMMKKEMAHLGASIALAALLITSAFGQQSEDNQDLKPVDLTKAGFDITLQALPSGVNSYESLILACNAICLKETSAWVRLCNLSQHQS